MASTDKPVDWRDTQFVEDVLLNPNITQEESQKLYKQWAETGTYDEMAGSSKHYTALDRLVDAMKDRFPNPGQVKVLDVGAGTGLTGKRLRELGYTNMDALEPLETFAEQMKEKKLYNRIFVEFLGDTPTSVPGNTYDAIVTTGAFGPGHIPCSGVVEILRMLKPGGYFVNCMREEYFRTVADYRDRLVPLFDQLEKEGQWVKILWEIYPNHFSQKNGVMMVFQKC